LQSNRPHAPSISSMTRRRVALIKSVQGCSRKEQDIDPRDTRRGRGNNGESVSTPIEPSQSKPEIVRGINADA